MFDNNLIALSLLVIFIFCLGYFLMIYLMPITIMIAIKIKLLDSPGTRKVHKYSKPRIGGLLMFCIYFFLLVLIGYFFKVKVIFPIAVGSLLISFFGFLDDLFNIRAIYKLTLQLLVAILTSSVLFGFGINISELHISGELVYSLGILSVPFTVFWIIGIMNAINLIDGLDGLAGSIVVIAGFSLFVCAVFWQNIPLALIIIALLSVVVGFLKYNFNPAKVFMGDTGSLLLGYNLSVFSILACWNQPKAMAFGIPLILLGIPIYDVLTAIIRRLKRKQHIFYPDDEHIHHRIMKRGFTHKQTVVIISFQSLFLAVGALTILFLPDNVILLYLIVFALLIHFSMVYLRKKFS